MAGKATVFQKVVHFYKLLILTTVSFDEGARTDRICHFLSNLQKKIIKSQIYPATITKRRTLHHLILQIWIILSPHEYLLI
jgi:hypothetical protein